MPKLLPEPMATAMDKPQRFAAAPYQFGSHFERRAARSHPAQPLVWAVVLTFVPLFWMVTVAWFARMVF
ncbi:hypothetical protein [Tropicibacter naphthalenivorans]|uniref:Uncharacterized protein n=1 Tax=Tropicibacter naphthalenivorans TaxID=441103 RepID=A0A0P1G9H9_9RHOB|nr:hypothetical protein [Tropicibacter naphthalenivorans]CUH78118.1 hypothetical protein TRN7648_01803 [Tropicibacter naphthalenivorans]SMC93486.1 hypothetical protein SAMN04488093_10738 [Tropicibacter naphthalenivorans]